MLHICNPISIFESKKCYFLLANLQKSKILIKINCKNHNKYKINLQKSKYLLQLRCENQNKYGKILFTYSR